jgi:hypothetical protein
MKIIKRIRLKGLVLMMSILLTGVTSMPAETDEPGPFERLFRAMRRGFNEPQHRSAHRTSRKQTDETKNSTSEESNTHTTTGGVSAPPSERNTRTATRVTGKKQSGLAYGKPVPGKTGLVTSPYSPEGGYIDVRGFAPGTPVKDPYSGKIFLTP